MTAASTALRVLRWAREGGVSAPPEGDLADVAGLAEPAADLVAAAATLSAVTQARLRLGSPRPASPHPGSPSPGSPHDTDRTLTVAPGVAVAAAVVGGRRYDD